MAKTVMIVDDIPDIRSSVRNVLESTYDIVEAEDGDQCLKQLTAIKPNLILMDVKMPGTPVEEVIKKIKNTKIIILTVLTEKEVKEKGLLDLPNVIGYQREPFDVKELSKRVNEAIGI